MIDGFSPPAGQWPAVPGGASTAYARHPATAADVRTWWAVMWFGWIVRGVRATGEANAVSGAVTCRFGRE